MIFHESCCWMAEPKICSLFRGLRQGHAGVKVWWAQGFRIGPCHGGAPKLNFIDYYIISSRIITASSSSDTKYHLIPVLVIANSLGKCTRGAAHAPAEPAEL